MIETNAELNRETSFREWAYQFSGKYFVMIQIFADESGTHDPLGNQVGSQYPVIAGFAARKSVWERFIVDWKAVLGKYDAPYFHGRELSAARAALVNKKPETKELLKNPYYKRKWDVKIIDSFHDKLTKVAVAGNKIPIVGAISIPIFNELIKDGVTDKDPYKYCMSEFFRLYHQKTSQQWGNFKSDVSFFFDRNSDQKWRDAIHEVFSAYAGKDTRMRGPYFDEKTKLIQLQAADLLAYRARQQMDYAANGKLMVTDRDKILVKNIIRQAVIENPSVSRLLK